MHCIRGLRSAIRRALAVIGRNTKRISKTFKSSCRTRIDNYICTPLGRLAQLVQSTCLTSRGSGVRIPQRPQLHNPVFKRLPNDWEPFFMRFGFHCLHLEGPVIAELRNSCRCKNGT